MAIHLDRVPESVVYRDRDIISIVPMTAEADIDLAFIGEPVGDSGNIIYIVQDLIYRLQRFLAYFRTSTTGEVSNGLHAAFWVDTDTAAPQKAYFFKEVISPKLTYDRDSNILTMLFWSNFKSKVTEYSDSSEDLITFDEYKYDPNIQAYQTLCVSYGSIQRWIVTGGTVPTTGASSDSSDIIPVFTKPKIIMSYPHTRNACDATLPGTLRCIPVLDFLPENIIYKAVADENEAQNTVAVKTIDIYGNVCDDDEIITLPTLRID